MFNLPFTLIKYQSVETTDGQGAQMEKTYISIFVQIWSFGSASFNFLLKQKEAYLSTSSLLNAIFIDLNGVKTICNYEAGENCTWFEQKYVSRTDSVMKPPAPLFKKKRLSLNVFQKVNNVPINIHKQLSVS